MKGRGLQAGFSGQPQKLPPVLTLWREWEAYFQGHDDEVGKAYDGTTIGYKYCCYQCLGIEKGW